MEHACNGFFREQWARARICSRNLQALFDVIPCLVCVQRAKLSANSNSLFELLDEEEARNYINQRLQIAGANPGLVCVQRAKLSANSNSLFELPEADRIQFFVE